MNKTKTFDLDWIEMIGTQAFIALEIEHAKEAARHLTEGSISSRDLLESDIEALSGCREDDWGEWDECALWNLLGSVLVAICELNEGRA